MRAIFRLINRFRRDRRGNVAVTFIFASVPLIAAIGGAIDYGEAVRVKSKLQSAADAAAIASISQQSPGWVAASTMSGNGEVTVAETAALNIFNGSVQSFTPLFTGKTVTATVTKTGPNITSTVTFSANVPVNFLGVLSIAFSGGMRTPLSQFTVTGSSSASSSLPLYLDFYVMLDVSGSMGLPSTNAEETRLAAINPDNFRPYPAGCTLACHFQANSNCPVPPTGTTASAGVLPAYSAYPTNGYCLGYLVTRVSQSGYVALLNSAVTATTRANYPMKNGQVLPPAMLPNVTASVVPGAANSLLTGNSKSLANSLTAVTSCPTPGTDACIQLRADAVGTALNATVATQGVDGLFATANKSVVVANQFRIGLYPFIRDLITYSALTSNINASPTSAGTINYNAANLATLLDTGDTPNVGLGSGGTHFENAFPQMNTIITSVGDGSAPTNTKPFVFLVTDGAQNFQICCSFSGSNSATVMPTGASSYCQPLKNRGITIAVLYIPYEPIQNPTTIYNNEDNVANANIANIPPSLQACASPNFFFTANAPSDIAAALSAMFNLALQTAHLTN